MHALSSAPLSVPDKTHAQQIPSLFCEAPVCFNTEPSLTVWFHCSVVSAKETLHNNLTQ